MKFIQSVSDIEFLKATKEIPMELIKEIEKDFFNIYEAESEEVYLLNYRLSLRQALFVFEKGDDVLAKLNDPFALEYVERLEVDEVAYYRCALRNDPEIQLYYSLVNIHDEITEEWLHEQAEWNKGLW